MSNGDPVDDSQSVEALDESTLLPLAESPGVLADDPDLDSEDDHQPFPDPGFVDDLPIAPDQVPGQDVMPGQDVIPA
jgi:hypothetical protein